MATMDPVSNTFHATPLPPQAVEPNLFSEPRQSFIKVRERRSLISKVKDDINFSLHPAGAFSLTKFGSDIVSHNSDHDTSKSCMGESQTDELPAKPNSIFDTIDEEKDEKEPSLQQQEDAQDYIKTIFTITKVSRKTRKQVRISRHRHVISHCPHTTAPYYAKGMCKKCYFKQGQKKKKATRCEHKDRAHYATGLCKLCYLKEYHKTHDRKKKL